MREAPALLEEVLGANRLDVAASLKDLAELLRLTAGYNAIKPHYERASCIRDKAFGPDHSMVAQSLSNLGILRYFLWVTTRRRGPVRAPPAPGQQRAPRPAPQTVQALLPL